MDPHAAFNADLRTRALRGAVTISDAAAQETLRAADARLDAALALPADDPQCASRIEEANAAFDAARAALHEQERTAVGTAPDFDAGVRGLAIQPPPDFSMTIREQAWGLPPGSLGRHL